MQKNLIKKYKTSDQGFSLIEVLVSVAILMILFFGIYNMVIFTLRLNADNQSYVIAMNMANQKIEYIRNIPYTDVGTIAGSPSGIIPEYEDINKFTVHTTSIFYDDPYDGLQADIDTVFTDYKIVTIEVSWLGRFATKKVTVFSKVIPNTEETWSGYGLLKLMIVDSAGTPVSGANIHIENSSPLLNVNYTSDAQGEYSVPLLPDLEGYEVTVSKVNYSTDQTHTRDAVNLNPTKPHLSVFDGLKTEEAFTIDLLGALTIQTVTNNLPENFQVNTDIASSTDTLPQAGIDAADNLYFAWEDDDAITTEIKIQKFNSSQVKQWVSDKTISPTRFQKNPDIAVSASGDSYVVWQDNSSSLKLTAYNQDTDTKYAKLENSYNLDLSSERYPNDFTNYFLKNSYKPWSNTFNNFSDFFSNINQKYSIKKTQIAQAAETATIVQTALGSPGNYVTSLSANFSSTPTEGNTIIAVAMHRGYVNFFAPSNANGVFTEAMYSNSSWPQDIGIWYKEAEASEPTQATISATSYVRGGVLMLLEINGIDVFDPLQLVTNNIQNSNTSNSSYSGSTAVSEVSGFAITATGFADNNYTTPNSSNWTSDSSDSLTHKLWQDWSTGRDGSLAVSTANITNADNQGARLSLSGGGAEERNSVLAIFNLTVVDNATLSSIGTQVAELVIPSTNNYLGGAFTITENTSTRDINSITIKENGTIDAINELANVTLYYDIDTSIPYDCASESFAITDTLFGASTTFDNPNGIATFTEGGGITIDTTQTMCVYTVLDILSTANKDNTIEISIDNPTADVLADTGLIIPASTISIVDTTTLKKPAEVNQAIYRFRNDDGDETLASSMAGENASLALSLSDQTRLRFSLYNSGSLSSGDFFYRLEYGEKATNCESISTWIEVPTDLSKHWSMTATINYIDNSSSSNVASVLADPGTTFIPGYLKSTSNQTLGIDLGSDDFTEIEYSISPTINAVDSDYCFRLTNTGATTSIVYSNYPEASIIGDDNVYIIGLDSDGNEKWAVNKINSDMGAEEQSLPRIALTETLGRATTSIVWQDYRNANADIYAHSFDEDGNEIWGSEIQITSSSTDEVDANIAFDTNDNIFITWTNNNTYKEVYLDMLDLSGAKLWANPINIIASSSDNYESSIFIDNSNYVYIIWTNENIGLKKVYLSKFDATSTSIIWTSVASVDAGTSDQFEPSISVNNQYIYITWTDQRENNNDIYSQKFDLSGNPQWANDLKININIGSSNQSHSKVLIDSTGNPISTWEDLRNINSDIFATKYSDPGLLVSQANVPLIITGTKQIGDNPIIIKNEHHLTSDASGFIYLTPEWDAPGYSIEINPASSSLDIIMRNPIQPMEFLANDTKTMLIYVE